jgi:hypothetical protein
MKQVTNVLEFANAAAIERINYELVKVLENIQNPNTDEKPRKLTVELCITPVNNRTTVNIKTTVKKALRPTNAVHTQMAMAVMDGTYQLVESGCGYLDGQADLFGEVHETNYVQIKKSEE